MSDYDPSEDSIITFSTKLEIVDDCPKLPIPSPICSGEIMQNCAFNDSIKRKSIGGMVISDYSKDDDIIVEIRHSQPDISTTGKFLTCYKKLSVIPILFFINLGIILLLYIPLRSVLQLNMLWSFEALKQSLELIQENMKDTDGSVFLPLLALYSAIYIFIQTFCIPGSILLNCMGGAIFGIFTGTIVCSSLTAIGSLVVYLFCKWIGEEALSTWFGPKIGNLNRSIENMSANQRFFYLLALRIFPLTPQYLLNLASPFVGIGLGMFLTSMIIGLLPFHFITVRAGSVITQIQSSKDILQTETVILLCLISILLLTPPILKKTKRFEKYFSLP